VNRHRWWLQPTTLGAISGGGAILFSALLARHTDASGDVTQLVVWGGLEESFGADWLVGGVTS